MNDDDRRLKDLLGPQRREADAVFVERLHQIVLIEQQLQSAHRLAWKRFARDSVASAVVLLMVSALSALPASGPADGAALAISPGTVASLVFVIWAVVALRSVPQSNS